MPIQLPSHLHRNRFGVYGFRVVIPRDIRLLFPTLEIRTTLRTTSRSAAKPLALRLTLLTENYFAKIRSASSHDEAFATVQEFIQTISADCTFDELNEKLLALTATGNSESSDLMRRVIKFRIAQKSLVDAKLVLARATIDQLPDKADSEIDSLFCDFYADLAPLMGEEKALVSEFNSITQAAERITQRSIHSHEVAELHAAQRSQISNITDIAAEIAAKATLNAANGKMGGLPTIPMPESQSEQLAAIVEAYCANQISEGSWTAKTEAENKAIYGLWLRIVGDQPIRSYGFKQHRDYKTSLAKLPANLNKSPIYRDKSIGEILEMTTRPAAPNTINKNLTRVAALFRWAVEYGYTTLNPAGGMTIKNPKRASEERHAFTDDDLIKIFHHDDYLRATPKVSYKYWAPLIALFTGARLNEIAQLHLDDFLELDDVAVININDQGEGKRLKTKAGKRTIPIHSELVRLGLLRYVSELRTANETRMFPELKLRRDGYGQTISKWFQRYRRQCGMCDDGKVFHSFRHTVIDRLKQADVPKEKIAALVGHEDNSVTFGRYGKDFFASEYARSCRDTGVYENYGSDHALPS